MIGHYTKVKETVPSAYYQDFDDGYNLKFTRHDRKNKPKKTSNTQYSAGVKPKTKTPQVILKPTPEAKPPKPAPLPIAVGETVVHKAFGPGTVYSVEGSYIRIRFATVGEKSFVNPDAFIKGFLKK